MAKNSIATAYVQIIPTTDGIKGELNKQLGGSADSAGRNAGKSFASGLTKAVAKIGIGKAIGDIFKSSMKEGAAIEQSFGGLETIYGDAAKAAKEYAAQAAAAGVSTNSYAEQAVSFGAALKQAYGGDTAKAVEAANTAILDMTDNAAKMGTPLESIQNAYQGFAKQNYTMLDNLKLGYGGTEKEMQRLLADAQALTGVEYDINNLGDVYAAIHAVQGELGLTGVAAAEASTTLSGSFGAVKAAWQNTLGNIALGEDIKPSLDQLSNSVQAFFESNLIPMAKNVASGLTDAISGVLSEKVPALSFVFNNLETVVAGVTGAFIAYKGAMAITGIISAVRKATENQTLAQAALNLVMNANPFVLVATLAAGLGAALITLWKTNEKFRDAVKNIWENVKSIFTSAGADIKGVFDSIKAKFEGIKNIGENLVTGLWSGISDKVGWILDKIRGFGSSVISAIQGIFGVHSPSTETAWMGDMLMQGLAKGILGSSGVVKNAVDTATGVTLRGFNQTVRADYGGYDNAPVIGAINDLRTAMSGLGIYLDGDALVGGISSRVDSSLGKVARRTVKSSMV